MSTLQPKGTATTIIAVHPSTIEEVLDFCPIEAESNVVLHLKIFVSRLQPRKLFDPEEMAGLVLRDVKKAKLLRKGKN